MHPPRARAMQRCQGFESLMLSTLAAIKAVADRTGIGAAQLAIGWTLMNEQVISVIPGASSAKQLNLNMASSAPLDPTVKVALDEATDDLRAAMGPALDIYQSDAGQRSF